MDRGLHGVIARAFGGISPVSLALAYQDWLLHLTLSPAKRTEVALKAARKWRRLMHYAAQYAEPATDREPCIMPLPQDRRFKESCWCQYPFDLVHQSFLLTQQLWHNATTGVPGVTAHHEKIVEFYSRQLLDMASPSNFLATNPELLRLTWQSGGFNLVSGYFNLLDDMFRAWSGERPTGSDAFAVGKDVAATPGHVVYRNDLMELIQYAPTTDKVRSEPIVVIPAWIMKYYILDLSRHNSLVGFLVDEGFTVFVISWRNPGADQRNLSFDDYRTKGVLAAFDAVSAINGKAPIHAVGYCLGGTLLLIAAAAMARDRDRRIGSISLLAAQADFTDAGELTLFIDESQIDLIEDLMWQSGYLDAGRMLGAFQLLRSRDLIWSRIVQDYLRGSRKPSSDLMAWNNDATRMPYRMHLEYLRKLFLNNELAEGRYKIGGRPVFIEDITAPIFMVATERDHVAPWRSVFKLNTLLDSEATFLLATGGHNTGIVAPPGRDDLGYRMASTRDPQILRDPDAWLRSVESHVGSWWPAWVRWLNAKSSRPRRPPSMGCPIAGCEAICPAPGTYVLQR